MKPQLHAVIVVSEFLLTSFLVATRQLSILLVTVMKNTYAQAMITLIGMIMIIRHKHLGSGVVPLTMGTVFLESLTDQLDYS